MTTKFARFATIVILLAGDGPTASVSAMAADPAASGVAPTIDLSAAESYGSDQDATRSGGQATRIELVDAPSALSAWYRLAYVAGGSRLQVFEHYPVATANPDPEIVASETTAWRLANSAVAHDSGSATSDQLPRWARFHTGHDTGPSAGLMFALAYIDALTPGALVGDLRVAGTGAIGSDGVVTPVRGVEVKMAAALLTRPDVVFTPSRPRSIAHVTIVDSEHTRLVADGHTVGEWLNVSGYEQTGRDAANNPGTTAVVVVHDLRQALAFLCGRTGNATTCAAAHQTATIPIGTP